MTSGEAKMVKDMIEIAAKIGELKGERDQLQERVDYLERQLQQALQPARFRDRIAARRK